MTPSLCSGTAVTYLVNPPLLKSLWKAAEETNEEGGGFFSSSSACDMLVPIWGDMICDYMIGFEGLWPGYFFWYGGPALVDDAEQGLQCIYENLKTTVVCIRILSLRIFHNFGSWPNRNPNAFRFVGEPSHTEMPPHPRMSCPHKMKNPVHRTRLLEMVWVSGKWREFRPPPMWIWTTWNDRQTCGPFQEIHDIAGSLSAFNKLPPAQRTTQIQWNIFIAH